MSDEKELLALWSPTPMPALAPTGTPGVVDDTRWLPPFVTTFPSTLPLLDDELAGPTRLGRISSLPRGDSACEESDRDLGPFPKE